VFAYPNISRLFGGVLFNLLINGKHPLRFSSDKLKGKLKFKFVIEWLGLIYSAGTGKKHTIEIILQSHFFAYKKLFS